MRFIISKQCVVKSYNNYQTQHATDLNSANQDEDFDNTKVLGIHHKP